MEDWYSVDFKANIFHFKLFLAGCHDFFTCNDHGNCTDNGTCKCEGGFYGDSCSSNYDT